MLGRWPVIAIAALLVALPAAAFADDGASEDEDLDFTLTGGVGYGPDYEGSDDYRVVPIWGVRVGNLYHPNTYVAVRGLRFDSNFLPTENFEFGLVADYDSDYDGVDDNAVNDLERPDNALHVGLAAGFEFTDDRKIRYGMRLAATYDVLHGNGARITPRASIRVPVAGNVFVNGSVSASWASGDYMTNRFGISDADALRSGLPSYDADVGFKDVELGLAVTYAFSKRWSLTASGGYQRMLGDAADSPIIEDRGDADAFRAGTVVNLRF